MTMSRRIALANLVVFAGLILAMALVVYDRTARTELAYVDTQLESFAARVITEFEDEWEEEPQPEWDYILGLRSSGLQSVYVSCEDVEGTVILASDSAQSPSSQTLARARHGEIVIETVDREGARFRQAVYPVPMDEAPKFTVTLTSPLVELESRLARLAWILVLSVSAALLLTSAATYLVTRWALAPMSQMVTVAEGISALHLDRRVNVGSGRDEVSRLGVALNGMMERIESAFKTQRQFVADASHELRTPLTVVIGELEHLQANIQLDEDKTSLTEAVAELDRLSRLVDQLLVLARLDAGRLVLEKASLRLDELLVECLRLVRDEAHRKQISLEVQMDAPVEIAADEVKLKSAILNLLDNAVRYTSNGGRVKTVIRHLADGAVELTVTDTGPGIPEADRPFVFDRFYRGAAARARQDGSGLGLAIARELVELHGGRLRLDGAHSGGASFSMELPATPSPQGPS